MNEFHANEMTLSSKIDDYSSELEKRDQRIRFLEGEVLRLGGGIKCPNCNTWEDIVVNNKRVPCYICGGLGYYLPKEGW